jgi:hypothetical protein
MKLRWSILALLLCFPSYMVRAAESKDVALDSDFLIDTSKPYVYLELDHVGPRKPLRGDEPNTGIWLRLKNNCRVPIVVVAIKDMLQNPEGALTLGDEVVPNPQLVGEDARMTGIIAPHGLEKMDDIVRFPNLIEEEVKSANATQRASKKPSERPVGYAHTGFDTVTLALIPPGGQVFFSVPSNHLSETWHFEIPFRLALPNTSGLRPPYSYLAFYQEDLKNPGPNAATPTH